MRHRLLVGRSLECLLMETPCTACYLDQSCQNGMFSNQAYAFIVLNLYTILHQETANLLKRSEGVAKTIESMALLLSRDTAWVVRAPNQRELFCIDYISSYLDSIHVVTQSFDWVSRCEKDESVVISVLNIYTKYMVQSESQQMPVLEPNSAAMKLFLWMSNVQNFLITWKEKFTKHLVNYDQIVNYKHHLKRERTQTSV